MPVKNMFQDVSICLQIQFNSIERKWNAFVFYLPSLYTVFRNSNGIIRHKSLSYTYRISLFVYSRGGKNEPSDALMLVQGSLSQNGNWSIPFNWSKYPNFSIPLCPVFIVDTSVNVPLRYGRNRSIEKKKLKMGNQWTDKWDFDATYAK